MTHLVRAARCASAALLALAAAAQDWGTVGAWELVSSATPPPGFVLRKPMQSAGCFIVMTNDTVTGAMGASQFDVIANAWSAFPPLPPTLVLQDPYMVGDVAGLVVAIDELAPANVAVLDASNVALGWQPITLGNAFPGQRFGQRFAQWGSLLYSFAGVEVATGVTHNDVWAVDLGQWLTRPQSDPAGWVQVAADGTTGVPPGRVGYSITNFAVGMVIYGGVSLLPPNARGYLPDVCFDPTQSSLCDYHDSVWAFVPGNKLSTPGPGAITAASFLHLNQGVVSGGVTPAGRFDHTAGAMGAFCARVLARVLRMRPLAHAALEFASAHAPRLRSSLLYRLRAGMTPHCNRPCALRPSQATSSSSSAARRRRARRRSSGRTTSCRRRGRSSRPRRPRPRCRATSATAPAASSAATSTSSCRRSTPAAAPCRTRASSGAGPPPRAAPPPRACCRGLRAMSGERLRACAQCAARSRRALTRSALSLSPAPASRRRRRACHGCSSAAARESDGAARSEVCAMHHRPSE